MTNKNSDEMEIEISNIQKVYNFINEMVEDITLANIEYFDQNYEVQGEKEENKYEIRNILMNNLLNKNYNELKKEEGNSNEELQILVQEDQSNEFYIFAIITNIEESEKKPKSVKSEGEEQIELLDEKEKFHMENVLEGVEIALARHIYVIGDDITKESLNESIESKDYQKIPSNEFNSFLQLINNILILNMANSEIPEEYFVNFVDNLANKYGMYPEGEKFINTLSSQRYSGKTFTSESVLEAIANLISKESVQEAMEMTYNSMSCVNEEFEEQKEKLGNSKEDNGKFYAS